ncbi:hypothetical protein PIB30_046486 [Stylosanthes scabra]|uniref:Uncharacterized protein n=1 Tax=Stylosanthes scabra TaxID=79078 RepID=A0ABU6VEU7_9FABA|nr:hypothetical protein [Stylosanthes scabra]
MKFRRVYDKLSPHKKALIDEMGLGAFQHIPSDYINHKILNELVRSYNVFTNKITTSLGEFLITSEKVGHAFGLNYKGDLFEKKPKELEKKLNDEEKEALNLFKGKNFTFVENMVKECPIESEEERRTFKRAFALFIQKCFLLPTSTHYISPIPLPIIYFKERYDGNSLDDPNFPPPWIQRWSGDLLKEKIKTEDEDLTGLIQRAKMRAQSGKTTRKKQEGKEKKLEDDSDSVDSDTEEDSEEEEYHSTDSEETESEYEEVQRERKSKKMEEESVKHQRQKKEREERSKRRRVEEAKNDKEPTLAKEFEKGVKRKQPREDEPNKKKKTRGEEGATNTPPLMEIPEPRPETEPTIQTEPEPELEPEPEPEPEPEVQRERRLKKKEEDSAIHQRRRREREERSKRRREEQEKTKREPTLKQFDHALKRRVSSKDGPINKKKTRGGKGDTNPVQDATIPETEANPEPPKKKTKTTAKKVDSNPEPEAEPEPIIEFGPQPRPESNLEGGAEPIIEVGDEPPEVLDEIMAECERAGQDNERKKEEADAEIKACDEAEAQYRLKRTTLMENASESEIDLAIRKTVKDVVTEAQEMEKQEKEAAPLLIRCNFS